MKTPLCAPRYLTQEKASVQIYGKKGLVIADLKNLSRSGACIEWARSDFELQPGDLVRMNIPLSSLQKNHNLSGEIVWRENKSSGLYFLDADRIFEKLLGKNRQSFNKN